MARTQIPGGPEGDGRDAARPDATGPDADGDDHDQRIADLRAQRRARVRVLAIRSGAGIALLAAALIAFAIWLLTSVGGRDLLLRQIVARLPANAALSWQQVDGPARGPLTLRGVRFVYTPTIST